MAQWYPFPALKPMSKGHYLVTFRRPQAGKWIEICNWDGEAWTRNRDVAAWMVLPKRYGGK